MGVPLASPDDVEILWRPLTGDDLPQVAGLIRKASALLRQLIPAVDDRIALATTAPTSPRALDPDLVADVVATAVKNYLDNPRGATATTVTKGAISESETLYGNGAAGVADGRPHGELGFTPSLLARLHPHVPLAEASRPIRSRPALAPWPLGRYGGPNPYGQDFPDLIVPATYGDNGSLDASVPHPYDGRP